MIKMKKDNTYYNKKNVKNIIQQGGNIPRHPY